MKMKIVRMQTIETLVDFLILSWSDCFGNNHFEEQLIIAISTCTNIEAMKLLNQIMLCIFSNQYHAQ